jgi:tetratricopeptide (TPR) repeat protein
MSILTLQTASLLAQTSSVSPVPPSPSKEEHLLGKCSLADFSKSPYNAWFQQGYTSYTPNTSICAALKKTNISHLRFKIFLGTWCGDSKREFPRLAKLLHELNVSENAIEIIAVNSADSLYKRSPTGEEKNADIFRVPTVLIFEQQSTQKHHSSTTEWQELARVVEYPQESWERDLMKIARREVYRSSYSSYPVIRQWLREGILTDTNTSVSGLASQLRHIVSSEGELNACAFVLLSRGQIQEAVTLYRVNASIFPQSSPVLESLAEGYEKLGKPESAIRALERALELDAKNTSALALLVKLKAKLL